MHAALCTLRKLPALPTVVLLAGLLCVLCCAGCDKHSRFTKTINGQSSITVQSDGLTRKLEAPCSFSIAGGKVTALAKGGVLSLQESGGPEAREAEVREKDGAMELWIKEGGAFRPATPAEALWLEKFLQAMGAESSAGGAGRSFRFSSGKGGVDLEKESAPEVNLEDESVPIPAALAQLKRRSFSHERQKGLETLIAKRALAPADQVAVVEAVFAQLQFGHEKVSALKKLIRTPGFSREARKAIIQRIDRLGMDHEKVEVQKALLELE